MHRLRLLVLALLVFIVPTLFLVNEVSAGATRNHHGLAYSSMCKNRIQSASWEFTATSAGNFVVESRYRMPNGSYANLRSQSFGYKSAGQSFSQWNDEITIWSTAPIGTWRHSVWVRQNGTYVAYSERSFTVNPCL